MAPQPVATEKPKAEPREPTIKELMAMLEVQGQEILTLRKQQAAANPAPREMPKLNMPDAKPWTIRVRAIRQGFYPNPIRKPDGSMGRDIRHIRRLGRSDVHPGDEFVLEKEGDFAGGPLGWMELATEPATVEQLAPPMSASRPVQDPLMAGILPTPGNPQRTIES